MHELVLELLRDQPQPGALARFPLDDGALVCAFRGPGRPRWIAKTAEGEAGIQRLRAEAAALGQMEAHADVLGIPRLLGWEDGTDSPDGNACLVQSGVAGEPALGTVALRRPWAPLPEETRQAAAWLDQFQQLVPPPRAATLGELEQELRSQIEQDCLLDPEHRPLLLPLLKALPPSPEPGRAAVAMHGDFWAGNVLLEARAGWPLAVRVIDWSGFGAGTALVDLLTWMAQLGENRTRRMERLARWQALLFAPGTVRDFLRGWSANRHYGADLARWAFYMFLLHRLRWELGLALQTRDAAERAQAQRDWAAIIAWLVQHRYPDPFTPLPV